MNVNWNQTQKNKDGIVTSLTKGIEGLFKKNKVTYMKGSGQFVDQNTMYSLHNTAKLMELMEIKTKLQPKTSSSQLEAIQQLFQVFLLMKRLLLVQLVLYPYPRFPKT